MNQEENYQQFLTPILEKAAPLEGVELVIGIPFLNTKDDVQNILSVLEAGLDTFYPDLKGLIVCVVNPPASAVENFRTNTFAQEKRVMITQMPEGLNSRGWAVRTLMDLAQRLTADLLILEPNLLTAKSKELPETLTTDWIKLMYQPVHDGHAQFVLPRFKSSYLDNSIGDHFAFPLLASLFNTELKGSLGAGMAISCQLLSHFVKESPDWSVEVYDHGIDYWLVLSALKLKADIAEVYLGVMPRTSFPIELNYLFKQAAHVLFQGIDKNQDIWKKNPQAVRSALAVGTRENLFFQELTLEIRPYLEQFRRGFSRYYEAVWLRIFPEELVTQIKDAAASEDADFFFPATLWSQLVFESLIAYHFVPVFKKEDLVNSLTPLFQGRLAGFLKEIAADDNCDTGKIAFSLTASPFSARHILEEQIDDFLARKNYFLEKWLHHKDNLQPFLPEIAYWEYIPGIPVILPHVVKSTSGKSAQVVGIYEGLLNEYNNEFDTFIRQTLGLSPHEDPKIVGQNVGFWVEKVEKDLDQLLLPGNIHSTDGVQDIADKIFHLYPSPKSYSLKKEVAEKLLRQYPPPNLATFWGCHDTEELLKDHNPLDILALSSWSEENRYTARNVEWLLKNLKPGDFEISPIVPLVVNFLDFPAMWGMKEAPTLNHLTSRIVISNLRKGSGGRFPKTRFLTTLLKSIIEAEQFGLAWESYAKTSGKEFRKMVINSLEGHWVVSMFSAHSIFENIQQQILKKKLLEIANHDWGKKGQIVEQAKKRLEQMASVYHLGLTMTDGSFISCSLWSWASYSFKGGKGTPTPLSIMVERRWFSAELFSRCYEQVGGKQSEILPKIIELIGQGKEHENLAVLFLGAPPNSQDVIIEQKIERDLPPAGQLIRSPLNPILLPIPEHSWESKYVLNCGAIRVNGYIYILYRAVGEDGISRIGLAISKNGLQVDERLPEPVFSPSHESEKMGCEDPRLIKIEGRIYMLYTAYDGLTPQIALASISEDDLIHQRWQHWNRHGLVFPGFPNKDAVLFPERFSGKLVMYHRIVPSIWVTFSSNFDTPWPREGHKIVMGSRSGMMWDAVKIGAGAPPLKTCYGWLHIYHGVDYGLSYRLGVFLTSLDNPAELIYRSPNPILEPEKSFEIGISGQSWIPNVVFTCGAVPSKDKAILEDDDEIMVYYGGADTVIGVASARVADLIPDRFRKKHGVTSPAK